MVGSLLLLRGALMLCHRAYLLARISLIKACKACTRIFLASTIIYLLIGHAVHATSVSTETAAKFTEICDIGACDEQEIPPIKGEEILPLTGSLQISLSKSEVP